MPLTKKVIAALENAATSSIDKKLTTMTMKSGKTFMRTIGKLFKMHRTLALLDFCVC